MTYTGHQLLGMGIQRARKADPSLTSMLLATMDYSNGGCAAVVMSADRSRVFLRAEGDFPREAMERLAGLT